MRRVDSRAVPLHMLGSPSSSECWTNSQQPDTNYSSSGSCCHCQADSDAASSRNADTKANTKADSSTNAATGTNGGTKANKSLPERRE